MFQPFLPQCWVYTTLFHKNSTETCFLNVLEFKNVFLGFVLPELVLRKSGEFKWSPIDHVPLLSAEAQMLTTTLKKGAFI